MIAQGERFLAGAIERRGRARGRRSRSSMQVVGFSGFGFPKAHAAAFGLLAYQSTWLRVHYGPEFLCSLLNEQPMGFYPPDALVHEAQRRGIELLRGRRQRERGRVLDGGRRRADRARLRERRARGRDGGAGRRAGAERAVRRRRRAGLALGGERGRARAACLGRRLRRPRGGRAAGGAVAARDHGRGAAVRRRSAGKRARSAGAAAGACPRRRGCASSAPGRSSWPTTRRPG